MVRPERVRAVARRAPENGSTVAGTVTDLTFQGPVVRLSLAAPDGSPVVAHLGPEQDLPAAATRATRCGPLGPGRPPACCPPPRSPTDDPGSSRRCSDRSPHDRCPHDSRSTEEAHEPSPLPNAPTDPPPALERRSPSRRAASSAAAPPLAGGVALGQRSSPPAASDDGGAGERQRGGGPATAQLRISNWPLYMADGFIAAFQKATGITVDYKEDFNDNESGSPRTRSRCRASRTSAPTWWCRPSFMAARLHQPRLAQRAQRRRRPQQRRTCAPTCSTARGDPGAQVHRAVHVRHRRASAYNKAATGRRHHHDRRPVGSGVQGQGQPVLRRPGRARA